MIDAHAPEPAGPLSHHRVVDPVLLTLFLAGAQMKGVQGKGPRTGGAEGDRGERVEKRMQPKPHAETDTKLLGVQSHDLHRGQRGEKAARKGAGCRQELSRVFVVV